MNPDLKYLVGIIVLVIVLAVAAALLADGLRRRDFRRQITGKRPERRLDGDAPLNYDPRKTPDPELERLRDEARQRSFQNLAGPK